MIWRNPSSKTKLNTSSNGLEGLGFRGKGFRVWKLFGDAQQTITLIFLVGPYIMADRMSYSRLPVNTVK